MSVQPTAGGNAYVPTDANVITGTPTFIYNSDRAAPSITAVARFNPTSTLIPAGTQASWQVTFSEPISSSLSIADFQLEFTAGGSNVEVTGASISGLSRVPNTNRYIVSAIFPAAAAGDENLARDHTVSLALNDSGNSVITDLNGNPLSNEITSTSNNRFTYNSGTSAPAVRVIFGTATTDNYMLSFPITFDPPVALDLSNPPVFFDSSDPTDVGLPLFTITASGADATNVHLVSAGIGDPAITGRYIIRGAVPTTSTGRTSYTARLTTTNPNDSSDIRVLTANDGSGRTAPTSVQSSSALAVSRPSTSSVAIDGVIRLRTETLPEVGEIGAIEFLVTFNYPIRGLTGAHLPLRVATRSCTHLLLYAG